MPVACSARRYTSVIQSNVPDNQRSILLLFFGDTATDRRVQNFRRFFEQSGWSVELLAVKSGVKRGPRRFFEYHRMLANAVRAKRADVVLACDLYSLSAAAWLKRNNRVRLLIYDAREVYTELPTVANRPVVKWVWRSLERRGLSSTDFILTTGPNDVQAIFDIHHFLPQSVLVRNLPWRDSNLTRDRSLLERFGIPHDAAVLVYVGGLQEGRGLRKLIECSKTLTSIHVLLIGNGFLRQRLEEFAEASGVNDRVHFASAVPSDEALKIAAACDVGISLIEPISRSYELALPSKLFEYMMAGLPVVSSQLEQVVELFAEQEWIAFVDINDAESVQTGIRTAIEMAGNKLLRENERALALDQFHFERDASHLLTAITQRIQT
jgi:glycosyltransferase involved in cell wall biosynthesis